ncbi:MAG TPA: 1,2-phenylacetyl-CoA epoxidase subunit PaaD [Bacillales bacterium]|nr:1,2-phenylacetyl-CoA epoxidase subunit PaaD [Bacillales bacterium]HEU5138795.1 1,2-phenylacetyl-CoA epoxidase subunit PaaD [Bacillales bacterium]
MNKEHKEQKIRQVLENVTDPELPCINIVDLGMLDTVEVKGSNVEIQLLPTFSGCPALDLIKNDVVSAVRKAAAEVEEVDDVDVRFVYDPPWTTDRISPQGRENLKEYGVSPPPADHKEGEPWKVDCPYCGSAYTTMENIFGPTACRSILYCQNCKNPFEAMKPVANM